MITENTGKSFSHFRLSIISVWIILAGILIGHTLLPRYKYNFFDQELTYDVTSYYFYLPMKVIYHDPGMRNKATIDTIFARYSPSPTFYQAFDLDNGNRILNYTCGFAYVYAPFFFIAHAWATHSHYLADGFSFPYQFCIGNGVLIYILLGWFFLRKILIRYFSDTVASLVMLLTAFGTNYYSEAINNYLQPHAMLFSAYCILIYLVIKWHEKPEKKYMFFAGLLMGWMILSRPSEIVCLLIPLLWQVYDRESLLAKIKLVRQNFSHVLILAVCGIIVFTPQFMYWKKLTGHVLFFSYQHTEGFDFLHPHIMQVLFSFKKSLLVYTPILIFPIIGLILLRKFNKAIHVAVIVYALVNFYLLSSWAAWWNGGSFGMRYFTESYALMAIPFGYTLQQIGRRGWFIKSLSYPLIFFFVFLNLFQTWQFLHWIIPEDRMTYAYYKRIFLKTKVTNEDKNLAEIERSFAATESFDNENEYQHYTLAYYNFENINATPIDSSKLDTSIFHSPSRSAKLSKDNPYYPTYRIAYESLVKPDKDHVWLRVSLWYFSPDDIKKDPAYLVINMPHRDYNLKYRAYDFGKYSYQPGQWNKVSIDYMTPFPYNQKDKFEIYVWYPGNSVIYVDDLQVEVYERPSP